jgi:hypothetical protein
MTTTTIATFVGNGSQTDFAFSFDYLRKEFVKVLVDGIETAYTFHTTQTVRVTPAPAVGKVVIVRRVTDRDRLVQFVDGSILIANDLNVAALQSIHIASEALDQASGGLLIDETGAYSAGFRKLAQLGDPTNPRDAVNKQWAESGMTSQLALATAEKSAAVVAKDAAVVAKDAAVVSQGAAAASAAAALADRNLAQTAKTGADTAKAGADTAKTGADTAKTNADAAKVAAEAARDVTLGYRNTTQTLRDDTVAASLVALADANADAENKIINGDFLHWQRGVASSSLSGYVTTDRWVNVMVGGTVTHSLGNHALGDTFAGNNPFYYLRQTVSGQTLAGQCALTSQRIEHPNSYAGQTITVLGWARRSSGAGNMAVELEQVFGTGGSPSPTVSTPGGIVTLTGSWAPFAVTINVPSVTGKVLGALTWGYLGVNFWTSGGTTWAPRQSGLGLQTIGVDLWGIHIRVGTWTAAATNLYRTRNPGTELTLCQRYFETVPIVVSSNGAWINAIGFCTTKRIIPILTLSSGSLAGGGIAADVNRITQNANASGASGATIYADAEL